MASDQISFKTSRSASTVQSRVLVATWSLRLRTVWSFPPTGPTSSVSRRSLAVWMSSSPGFISNVEDHHSSWTNSRTLSSCCDSSSLIIPERERALAYASEPRMSWSHIRLSKLMLSLHFFMMESVPPLKRPPAPKRPPLAPLSVSLY